MNPFTVRGSGKSVARRHRTVLAYWKFESISLQRRVNKLSVPRDVAEPVRELLALVANRAEDSVTALAIDGKNVKPIGTVSVATQPTAA